MPRDSDPTVEDAQLQEDAVNDLQKLACWEIVSGLDHPPSSQLIQTVCLHCPDGCDSGVAASAWTSAILLRMALSEARVLTQPSSD